MPVLRAATPVADVEPRIGIPSGGWAEARIQEDIHVADREKNLLRRRHKLSCGTSRFG